MCKPKMRNAKFAMQKLAGSFCTRYPLRKVSITVSIILVPYRAVLRLGYYQAIIG